MPHLVYYVCMRIAHVITTIDRGGAEQQLLTLVREQLFLSETVKIFVLKGNNSLIREFRDLGAEVKTLGKNGNIARQISQLRREIKNYSPDVVHAHLPRAELIARFSLMLMNYRLVITRHNVERFFPRNWLFSSSLLSRFVTRRATTVIGISDAVLDFIKAQKEISGKPTLARVYYGYDKNLSTLLVSPNTSSTRNVSETLSIGTIARLVPQKDIATLLRAFCIVNSRLPNARLTIIGDGVQKLTLQNLADSLGVSKYISWIPNTNRRIELLSSLDAFVLTSKYEGFGLVLLEAMQAKVPIVASRNSAISEVLGDSYFGLFATGAPESCAELVINMLNMSHSQRSELNRFYERNLERFDPAQMAKTISDVYTRDKIIS